MKNHTSSRHASVRFVASLAAIIAFVATLVIVAPPSPAGATDLGDRLAAGGELRAGNNLRSSDGRYRLWMQHDGNLVLYGPTPGAIWSTSTWGNPGAFVAMQGDGNLVVYSSKYKPLWSSGTYGTNATSLVLQSDANLVVYLRDRRPVWSRTGGKTANSPWTLDAGWHLYAENWLRSPNGQFTAFMQGDGNFVVYQQGSGAKWSTGTWGNPGANIVMQRDGNLVVYSRSGRPLWNSGTYGTDGRHVTMQNDGNLVIHNAGWTPRWSRFTGIIAPPPPPASSAAEQAARWAEARVGQVTTTENWNIQWYASARYWSGWCESYVEAAYGRRFSFSTATAHYVARRNAGQIRQGEPPRGAVVFWDAGIAEGHVAIAVGNGQVVGTIGGIGAARPVSRTSYLAFSGYRGWAMP